MAYISIYGLVPFGQYAHHCAHIYIYICVCVVCVCEEEEDIHLSDLSWGFSHSPSLIGFGTAHHKESVRYGMSFSFVV